MARSLFGLKCWPKVYQKYLAWIQTEITVGRDEMGFENLHAHLDMPLSIAEIDIEWHLKCLSCKKSLSEISLLKHVC